MSRICECKNFLENIINNKGYITLDEFLDATITFDLTTIEVDKLSEEYSCLGVLVENDTNVAEDEEKESTDYSRVDYELIYNEIIECAANLSDLVSQIKELPSPQHGEIGFLTNQIAHGIVAAKHRLIILHLRLVLKIAFSISQKEKFDLSEAVSAGMIGLIHATDKYKPKRNSSFQGYASLWIQQCIYRECNPIWMQHYFPHHIKELIFPMMIAYNDVGENNKDLVTFLNDFAYSMNRSFLDIVTILRYVCNEINGRIELDKKNFGEEIDIMYDGTMFIENNAFKAVLKEQLDEVLETLTLREKRVIELRYGLGDGRERTLEEVSHYFGVTRERIRQIEFRALKKLRHPSRSRRLKDF